MASTYMYNTTPRRSTQTRFSVKQASYSPGFAGTASGEIEAFIWRCKQDNEPNVSEINTLLVEFVEIVCLS